MRHVSKLAEKVAALVEAADPEGSVTVRVSWLAELLSKDAATVKEEGDVNSPTEVDLTVVQVAKLFKRGASTVRTWLSEHEFPNAYRFRGREWRIPKSDVTALQDRHRKARVTEAQPTAAATTNAWPNFTGRNRHDQARSGRRDIGAGGVTS